MAASRIHPSISTGSTVGRNDNPSDRVKPPREQGYQSDVQSGDLYGSYVDQYGSVTMPDGTVLQNPYVLTNEEYELYQQYVNGKFFILSSDRRAAEAAYNKYQQMVQWYNENQNNAFDVNWNSEENQIERETSAMRENGLNPDIIGLSGGAAADTGVSDMRAPAASGISDFAELAGAITGVIGTVMSCVNIGTAVSQMSVLASQKKLLQSQKQGQDLTNIGIENSNLLSTIDIAQHLYDFMPDSFFEVANEDYEAGITPAFKSEFLDGIPMNEEQRKLLSNFMMSPSGTALADRWRKRHAIEQERQSYYWMHEDPMRYSPSNSEFALLRQQDNDRRKFEMEYQRALSRYNSVYAQELDPEIAGAAENKQKQVSAAEADVQLKGKKIIDSYLAYILTMSQSGSGFGQTAAAISYEALMNGGNMNLSGALSMFAPYFYEQYDKVSGWIHDPSSMPDELKKGLKTAAGVGAAYLYAKTYFGNVKSNIDFGKQLLTGLL